MQLGIITEGHSDRAVIANIIIGITKLNIENIRAILPVYSLDETDKAVTTFGGWTSVRTACMEKKLITDFLSLEGNEFVVIHFDTAEAEEYPVVRPPKSHENYSHDLRQNMINKINEWIQEDLSEQLLYAISIEEMDAWVLSIYDDGNAERSANVKNKLDRVLGRQNVKTTRTFDNYLSISENLSKTKAIKRGHFLNHSQSLAAFYQEVTSKTLTKLQADDNNI